MTQKQLADKICVDCSAVTKWETGKANPDFEKQMALADIFGVSIDYLLGRVSEKHSDSNYISVPVYGRIPAGIPTEAIEDILDYEDIPKDWLNGDKEYFSLQVKGDSMFPAYQDGDRVIFQKASTAETGDDAAVMVNGDDATFKRIERSTAGVILKPLNPVYETKFYSNEEIEALPVRVIGIAKELRRSVKR
jgi:repressor LexA